MRKRETPTRRYETDYAGAWRGKCLSQESAIVAAMRHVVNDGYTACTITDLRTNRVVARVHMSKDRRSALVESFKMFPKDKRE